MDAHGLEMKLGAGTMYHVTAITNRSSIQRWGLDWDHLGDSPGVAGSRTPEAPGIWLNEYADDDFFVEMARHAVELWEVEVTGLLPSLYPAVDRALNCIEIISATLPTSRVHTHR
jgi:hypothetical protein